MKTYKEFNEGIQFVGSYDDLEDHPIMNRFIKIVKGYGLDIGKLIQHDDLDVYPVLDKIKKEWKLVKEDSTSFTYSFKGLVIRISKNPLGLADLKINV